MGATTRPEPRAAAAGLRPLRSRLTPPALPVPHIPRPRLWELLDAASGQALTIVRGPAGCGKTALLASWYLARRDALPVVWLQVDPATDVAPAPTGTDDGTPAATGLPPAAPAGGTPAARASLWEHLLVALRAHPEADPDGALARLSPPVPGGASDLFCRELLDALAGGRPQPLVLIVDDLGLIGDPADIAGLELLAAGVAGLRLVLCGRRVPVSAHRARAAGQLTEIGPELLAFDATETDRLLAAMRVPAVAAPGLLAATAGWAAGVRLAAAGLTTAADLAALTASQNLVPGARALVAVTAGTGPARVGAPASAGGELADTDRDTGTEPPLPPAAFAPVAEYLRAEALATLPAPVRRLLLRTSVLDAVCAPLADVVAAEPAAGARLLAELAAGAILASPLATAPRAHGPAVTDAGYPGEFGYGTDSPGAGAVAGPAPADDGCSAGAVAVAPTSWYRYHLLLRGMLRETLRRDPAEDEAELNLRAALWYAANRRLVDAARHARRAGDWRYLACLVARGTVPLILQGELPELAALVGGFPDRAAGLGPECAITAALARVLAGDASTAGEHLELARSRLAAFPPAGSGGPVATRQGQAGPPDPADSAGGAASARRVLLVAIEAVELRRAELAGDVEATLTAARRVLRVRVASELGPAAGLPDGLRPLALAARGRAELWRGRLETAEDALRVALAEARRARLGGATVGCLGALALGYALRGRLRQADEAAAGALAAAIRLREVGPASPARAAMPAADGSAPGPGALALGAGSGDGAAVLGHAVAPRGAADDGQVDADRLAWLAEAPALTGVAEALLALATAAGHRGDTAGGLGWADLAAHAAGESGQLPDLVNLLRAWLRLGRRTGDDLRAARRALAAFPAREAPALLALVREATQADLLVAGGNPDAALRLLGPPDPAGRRERPAARLARGRAHLAQGDAAEAALAVAPLLRADGGGSASVVAACAISAVAAARRGDGAQAGGLLARAFALAQDELLVRPFLELGPEIMTLTDAHPGLPDAAPGLVAALRLAVTRDVPRRPPGARRPGSAETRARTGPPSAAALRSNAPRLDRGGAVTVPTARRAPLLADGHPGGLDDRGLPAAGEDFSHVGAEPPPLAANGLARGEQSPTGRPDPSVRPARPVPLPHGGPGRYPPGAAMADRRGLIPRDAADRGQAGAARPVGPETGLVSGGLAPFPAEREAGQPSAGRAGRGADRLSDRELAVLSYLPTMLTTAEIAAELYVSVNTVKTHLKSIYRKLDVARRRDAVHRARALHLL
ncbi:helix-turn-helix transcriptional regulator [Pseudofrankia inefficax]|uniref:ATP-dependent transcriptional regulator, MalT-like, LuxR family n=1 Tax=Pseudofrankia inefficax (strain DSM 45817 / CECT 9037 / DDB 130130 / EuI1c) TaxID=298654 RepID=E3J2B0_PSEI1|nr:LuxR family transcriptional regulator [Pseudofrankia inefficax]ADP79282.1 ATP-dependent transcriptional regulator, MalT-like, LuxR family [Pseudofrankia inefficax]